MIHRFLATACATMLLAPPTAAAQTANLAKYQFASANTFTDSHSPQYLTDGKIGPRNRWATGGGGRHRCNIFFDAPIEIGSLHVYSFGYDGGPIEGFDVNYRNSSGLVVPVPGASVSGNSELGVNLVFASPVTTDQIQLTIDDQFARIDEIAAFPPNGGAGFPLGTDIDPHLARQHKLALTIASSTAAGTTRRAMVDGYVNNTTFWQSGPAGPHTIEFDITDPPETSNPPSIRTETTPVLIGGFDLYSGLSNGSGVITRGKLQTFDGTTGSWTDIAGSEFTGNASGTLRVMLPAPVESARFRLVVNDLGPVIIREFVPLPAEPGVPWPSGIGVTFSDVLDYRELDDFFYTLEPDGTGLSLTTDANGQVSTQSEPSLLTQKHRQHYQVLLDVGTDTYRIRNRVSRLCLGLDSISLAAGTAVIETEYLGMPHQRWRRVVDVFGHTQFINAYSGLAIEVGGSSAGATLTQQAPSTTEPLQWFDLVERDHFPKKGSGGMPFRAEEYGVSWAYNWGKLGTDFPENVDYWPMQWGSFFWDDWPELVPDWKRDGDPYMLMGYNEPDAQSQSNIPVASAVAMWPRLEVVNTPLLGPAPVNPTNDWILDFMQGAADNEMRIEYAAVHRYPGPDANNFINSLETTYNTFGLDLIVSEFSVVDWNDTNSWTNDEVYNFFPEVFWRMEKLDYVKRFAIFVFTDDPSNPISDNRGEMLNADGTLTPEGKLFSAWDGDTVIRTDTPYHLHNEGQFKRPGSVEAVSGPQSLVLGDRTSDGQEFQWVLEPGSQAGHVLIRSVNDGRLLAVNGSSAELVAGDTVDASVEFMYVEAEHGWFHIDHPGSQRRLRINGSSEIDLVNLSSSGDWTRWRFIPVFEGPPGPPRDVSAVALSQGDVSVAWAQHGFRDLQSYAVYRTDSGGTTVLVADDVYTESLIDTVPAPGTYVYEVTAIGDTGESLHAASMPVSVDTCQADFNGDFIATPQDVIGLLNAVGAGLDYNGDGSSNFFDVTSFLEVYDAGCTP